MLNRLMGYDAYERHQAVRQLLAPRKDESILDAGGCSGQLAQFVSCARIVALNVDETGDVRYGGGAFPFDPLEFDVVVSLDVVEHIPAEGREQFVHECGLAARRAVLIAAPHGSAGHVACEARLDRLYADVHGEPHRWLHEHVVNGLPVDSEIARWAQELARQGFATRVLYAGDYEREGKTFERLMAVQRRRAWRVFSIPYSLAVTVLSWRTPAFSESASPTTNRFYLLGERT